MSSPIVVHKRSIFKNALIGVHQKYSHHNRISVLARRIASIIKREFAENKTISVLDIGCGDMQLAENLQRELPAVTLTCLDIHPLPKELQNDPRWTKYHQFDGRRLHFRQKQFDAAVFCDVLHHDCKGMKPLLAEAARVAKCIVVKDHFEYSLFSRWLLRTMDFVGNWGYGVSIPRAYLRRHEFYSLCTELGLKVKFLDNEIDIYPHLPLVNLILKPNLQFIALLHD